MKTQNEIKQLSFVTKSERDGMYRGLKTKGGYKLRKWVLRNQELGYSGFGTDRDMSRRSVYMLDVMETNTT